MVRETRLDLPLRSDVEIEGVCPMGQVPLRTPINAGHTLLLCMPWLDQAFCIVVRELAISSPHSIALTRAVISWCEFCNLSA